jgi:hypothetical protein
VISREECDWITHMQGVNPNNSMHPNSM